MCIRDRSCITINVDIARTRADNVNISFLDCMLIFCINDVNLQLNIKIIVYKNSLSN